jgi:hypothetical protein
MLGSFRDVSRAVIRGAILGAAFAATLGVAMLVRGQAVFASYETPYWFVVLIAIGAGATAGGVVGLFKPLTVHRWGSMALGALAGIIGLSALFFIAFGTYDWRWGPTILAGASLGATAGSWFGTAPRPGPPA